MFFKIRMLTLFLLMIGSMSASAQNSDIEKQRAEFEKKMQEELDSNTREFVGQLKVDDFKKEIIKQKIQSYFQERKKIYYRQDLKYYERDEQLSMLTNTHFSDIKELIDETTMTQIKIFVKDGGATLKKKKKKKKKN